MHNSREFMKKINKNNKNNYKTIWKVDFTFLDFQEFPLELELDWKVLKGHDTFAAREVGKRRQF